MKNKLFLFLVFPVLLVVSQGYAQEELFGSQQIISPEIHEDYSVTFRDLAPDAKHTWRNWRIYLSEFASRLFQD